MTIFGFQVVVVVAVVFNHGHSERSSWVSVSASCNPDLSFVNAPGSLLSSLCTVPPPALALYITMKLSWTLSSGC